MFKTGICVAKSWRCTVMCQFLQSPSILCTWFLRVLKIDQMWALQFTRIFVLWYITC